MDSKERCVNFLKKTKDIYFSLSNELVLEDMNESAICFFNLLPEKNANVSFLDLCLGEKNIIATYFYKEATHNYRVLMRHRVKDRQYFIRWEIIPLKGADGITSGYTLLGRDDTKLYEKNKLIKAELHLYEKIFSELPTNVYWKDKSSTYLGCNKRLAKEMGLPSKESISGMTDFDFDWGVDGAAESFIAFDRKVIETGKPLTVEDTFKNRAGAQVVVLTNKAPLRNLKGEIEGILAISVDITTLKELQKNLELEKEKAELANKAKIEFIANMSHDVKTPLSGIIAGADLLRYKASDPEIKSFSEDIFLSGVKLLEFFDDTLEMSTRGEGNLATQSEEVNLKALVNDLLDFFKMSLRMNCIDAVVNFDRQMPDSLLGDPSQIYRMLQNLLGNAIKFTKKGGSVELDFYCVDQSASDDMIIAMAIKDTGIGIPEDKQVEIFEKFNRLTSSYEGVYAGHGMGLYMVKQFVDAVGGSIAVKSKEGEGSCFTVMLPFKLPVLTVS